MCSCKVPWACKDPLNLAWHLHRKSHLKKATYLQIWSWKIVAQYNMLNVFKSREMGWVTQSVAIGCTSDKGSERKKCPQHFCFVLKQSESWYHVALKPTSTWFTLWPKIVRSKRMENNIGCTSCGMGSYWNFNTWNGSECTSITWLQLNGMFQWQMRARFGRLQTTCASVPSAFRIDVIVSNGHLDLRHLVLNHPWITCHRSAILLFWEVDGFVDGWDQLSHFQPFWSIPSSPFATVTAKEGRMAPAAGHTVPKLVKYCPWVRWFFTHLQLRKFWYCRL